MMGIALVLGWSACLERELDHKGCLARREARAIRDPKDMCVDRDRGLAKGDV